MMSNKEYIALRYDSCMAIGEQAAKFLFDEDEAWIPLSVIYDYEELETEQGSGTISVQEWFIEKNGLEVYIDED